MFGAPEWTLEEFEEMRRSYFKQRYVKNGLEFGATLEAAFPLFSAEIISSPLKLADLFALDFKYDTSPSFFQ